MQSFNVQLSPSGAVLDVQYASRRALDPISLAMIERQLQQKLALPTLLLKANRAPDSLRILEEAKKRPGGLCQALLPLRNSRISR